MAGIKAVAVTMFVFVGLMGSLCYAAQSPSASPLMSAGAPTTTTSPVTSPKKAAGPKVSPMASPPTTSTPSPVAVSPSTAASPLSAFTPTLSPPSPPSVSPVTSAVSPASSPVISGSPSNSPPLPNSLTKGPSSAPTPASGDKSYAEIVKLEKMVLFGAALVAFMM